MLKESLKTISLHDLYQNRGLSVRALNCCFSIDLHTVYDIVSYYEEGGSFIKMRNVGRKTSQELGELCHKFILQLDDPKETSPVANRVSEVKELIENDFFHTINHKLISPAELLNYLSPLKKILVEKRYKELVSSCSKRTAKWLSTIDFEYFMYDYLIEQDKTLMNIRNLGKKAYPELIALKRRLENELLNIIHSPEEAFQREKLILEKGKWFREDFVYDYHQQQGHMPLFWILEKELKSNDTREIHILLHSYRIFENDEHLTNKSLGEIHNLSTQRVNQIKNKTYQHFFSADNPLIQQLKEEWPFYQNSIKDDDILWQNDERISAFIEQENIHFTRDCILKLLSLFTDSRHTYRGSFVARGDDKTWKNSVLIPTGLADAFNFDRFIADIKQLVSINRIDIISDLEVYILGSPGWKKYKNGIIGGIVEVAKDILQYEFGLSIVSGKVIDPSPHPKKIPGILFEILKQQEKPMYINAIFTEFKKQFPQHKYTAPVQLRYRLSQHNQIISHKGQNNTYMLKEWEHIKSGTIGDTIVDFLEEHDTPQTIKVITDHVLVHYPETNEKSIRTIMYNDTRKRFSRFGRGCFGLSNKTYPAGIKPTTNISDSLFNERLADLERFLSQNWHFPFSASTDQNETSLYRWWRLQRMHFDKLEEKQKDEIERIKDQYTDLDTDKRAYEWNSKYNMLINFVSNNQRMPSSDSKGLEKMLHDWHNKTKNYFKTNRLNDEQRKKYLKFEKLAKKGN